MGFIKHRMAMCTGALEYRPIIFFPIRQHQHFAKRLTLISGMSKHGACRSDENGGSASYEKDAAH
jgi:hypothetical protein